MKRLRLHLKHWLIAHHKNDHRPHLIRARGLAIVVAAVVLVQGIGYAGHASAGHTDQTPTQGSVLAYATGNISISDLFAQTNQQREANGLSPLHLDNRLNTSSSLKAGNMFSENYWAHVSPSGIQPWYWFGQAGYSYSYAGENLAKDFDTTTGVMDGWMNSPGHRANILNSHYTDVGFAVQNGTLVGGQTTLVVAHYGTPSGVSVGANVVAPTPRPTVRPVAPAAPAAPAATPTPAPPTPTPIPTATPLATPTPAPPVPSGTITAAPVGRSYSPVRPLAFSRTASPTTIVTIVILAALLLVYVQTHLIVWRKGLRRWQKLHYRLWAGAQISGLLVSIFVLGAHGLGSVG